MITENSKMGYEECVDKSWKERSSQEVEPTCPDSFRFKKLQSKSKLIEAVNNLNYHNITYKKIKNLKKS